MGYGKEHVYYFLHIYYAHTSSFCTQSRLYAWTTFSPTSSWCGLGPSVPAVLMLAINLRSITCNAVNVTLLHKSLRLQVLGHTSVVSQRGSQWKMLMSGSTTQHMALPINPSSDCHMCTYHIDINFTHFQLPASIGRLSILVWNILCACACQWCTKSNFQHKHEVYGEYICDRARKKQRYAAHYQKLFWHNIVAQNMPNLTVPLLHL